MARLDRAIAPSIRHLRRSDPTGPHLTSPLRIGSNAIVTVKTFHSSGAISFSTKGEYGVRLMVRLAARYGRGPASLGEIALEEDLPRAYLEQLVMPLREARLVTSTRGARGGYELGRPPADIRMSEVLRALEGPLAPMICASEDPEHENPCGRTGTCTVNHLWIRVRDAIAGALDSMTLADLVPVSPFIDLTPRSETAAATPHVPVVA
jgi:Rrf2 family cysteine metabolism transcriptional repressor